MFDWLLSIGNVIVVKAAEVATAEAIEKLFKRGKQGEEAYRIRRKLFTLYQHITVLEGTSLAFIDGVEEFIKHEHERRGDAQVEFNYAWYHGWTTFLSTRAKDVMEEMKATSQAIKSLHPLAEIYIPNITDFFETYQEALDDEGWITHTIAREFQIRGEYVPNRYDNIIFEELPNLAMKIRQAVENLAKTRKSLAEFIKSEFSLSDF